MSGSFFDKLNTLSFFNKISRVTGANPNTPSLADEILYRLFGFLHRIKKQSFLFKNKYVCTDATIISTIYAIYCTTYFSNNDKIAEELMRKCMLATRDIYKVSTPDLKQMWDNHLDYFSDLIYELEDVNDYTLIVQEAALLFSYDLTYNKYVEFKSDTPVLITGLDKQFMIEQETKSFFNIMFPMIIEIIHKAE